MLLTMLKRIFSPAPSTGPSLPKEYMDYAEHAYPSNHTYKISRGRLIAKRSLASRFKKISKLFPAPLTSLAEIGSSKGFFVFSASDHPHCARSLGIDILEYDIKFCRDLKNHLQKERTRFELMKLHELAERIDEFGGSFQTILVLNIYQYLYFGSDRFSHCYLSHDDIFKNLRKVCSQRVIFCNRVNWQDCQNTDFVQQAGNLSQDYTEEKIIAAASKYFNVTPHGKIGRYPLWTLDVV